jgi:hypothetical protein
MVVNSYDPCPREAQPRGVQDQHGLHKEILSQKKKKKKKNLRKQLGAGGSCVYS